jgi:hypothetical protein
MGFSASLLQSNGKKVTKNREKAWKKKKQTPMPWESGAWQNWI